MLKNGRIAWAYSEADGPSARHGSAAGRMVRYPPYSLLAGCTTMNLQPVPIEDIPLGDLCHGGCMTATVTSCLRAEKWWSAAISLESLLAECLLRDMDAPPQTHETGDWGEFKDDRAGRDLSALRHQAAGFGARVPASPAGPESAKLLFRTPDRLHQESEHTVSEAVEQHRIPVHSGGRQCKWKCA